MLGQERAPVERALDDEAHHLDLVLGLEEQALLFPLARTRAHAREFNRQAASLDRA